MQIERGPGRGLSQAPRGRAGKRPKIDDFRSYPPQKLKNQFDSIGVSFAVFGMSSRGIRTGTYLRAVPRGAANGNTVTCYRNGADKPGF